MGLGWVAKDSLALLIRSITYGPRLCPSNISLTENIPFLQKYPEHCQQIGLGTLRVERALQDISKYCFQGLCEIPLNPRSGRDPEDYRKKKGRRDH